MGDSLPTVPIESRINALPLGASAATQSSISIFGVSMLDAADPQPTTQTLPMNLSHIADQSVILTPALETLATSPRTDKLNRDWVLTEFWCRQNLDQRTEIIPYGEIAFGKIKRRPNTYCAIQSAVSLNEKVEITWLDAQALIADHHAYMRLPSFLEIVENAVVNWKRAGPTAATQFLGVVLDMPRVGIVAGDEGVTLARFLKEYPDVLRVEEHRHNMMEQLARATEHLHSKKVLHRDISEDTIIIRWDYEQVRKGRGYVDVRPVVRIRLSHFIHSRRLGPNLPQGDSGVIVDPPCGPRLHYMAPEEFNVPSTGSRRVSLKADVWKLGLVFRQLHGLLLNTMDAEDEYDLWVETYKLVPVRYGRQEAEYITPLPKLINAMGSLLADGRWSSAQVLSVILKPGTAHHLPHPPLGLLKSVPDLTTQYPRYDPVVQKLRAPPGFSGGDAPLQPAVLVVPHLGHVWSSSAPYHENERCKVCSAVYTAEDPNAKYICLSCGFFHQRPVTKSPPASPPIPPVTTSKNATRIKTRHSFAEDGERRASMISTRGVLRTPEEPRRAGGSRRHAPHRGASAADILGTIPLDTSFAASLQSSPPQRFLRQDAFSGIVTGSPRNTGTRWL